MKESLIETREKFDIRIENKSTNISKPSIIFISFKFIILLMVFIPKFFIGKKENNKNLTFKSDSYKPLTNNNLLNLNIMNNNYTLLRKIYENYIIEENEEKDKCSIYDIDNKKCLKCSLGYKLLEGECLINYSFKAIYATNKRNENINLVNNLPNDIEEMIIDGKEVKPCKNFTFESKGQHIIYVLVDLSKLDSLQYMFYKINNLISISFTEKFNTEKIKYMNYLFSFCSSLININIKTFDTSNVLDMSYMFSGCPLIKSIDISNFVTKNVVNMDSIFLGCSSLTSIDLSNFDTHNVINMNNMFYGCSNLNNIILSSFNTENVKYMEGIFYSCSSLSSINISHFNIKNAIKMNYMFRSRKFN